MINVIVVGVNGKMGKEAARMIERTTNLKLICGVAHIENQCEIQTLNMTVGEVIGEHDVLKVPCFSSLESALDNHRVDVIVDFTNPDVVSNHIQLAVKRGVRAVVGTTGILAAEIDHLAHFCNERQVGVIMAPNFSIGAVLMMVFAAKAAEYLSEVEIIEWHHQQKLDAPSGTALKTAELITAGRTSVSHEKQPLEKKLLLGARGAEHHGIHIHSVRLPGLIAKQEVLLGGDEQLLSIKHESFSRESFMPGVRLAIEKVMGLDQFVYGLENIISV